MNEKESNWSNHKQGLDAEHIRRVQEQLEKIGWKAVYHPGNLENPQANWYVCDENGNHRAYGMTRQEVEEKALEVYMGEDAALNNFAANAKDIDSRRSKLEQLSDEVLMDLAKNVSNGTPKQISKIAESILWDRDFVGIYLDDIDKTLKEARKSGFDVGDIDD